MSDGKYFVPQGCSKEQLWQGLTNDLHRGATVGTPTSLEWHPHPIDQPCGQECKTVTKADLEAAE